MTIAVAAVALLIFVILSVEIILCFSSFFFVSLDGLLSYYLYLKYSIPLSLINDGKCLL